ncbi:MAG TPA: transglycosylase SLT domain-containing protein [Ignavibacteriaceae bacterium]|nr:transglycosylase SLT domain-containing protein [Ignavibacteriaceae bacterium]
MNKTDLSESPNANNKFLKVIVEKGDSKKKEYYFNNTFRIGREEHCAIQINHGLVSRDHVEISFKNGEWWIADLFSSNGTFIEGKKIDHRLITGPVKIELGNNGPLISIEFITESDKSFTEQADGGTLTSYIQRYFKDDTQNLNAGQHTRMIQQAFQVVKKKQSNHYKKIIAGVAVICIIVVGYAIYQQIRANEQRELAESIFYEMKGIELQLSKLASIVQNTGNIEVEQTIEKMRNDYKRMEQIYDKYVGELDVYDLNDQDRLILKMARVFGECEINVPANFLKEVKDFIKSWQSSPRLEQAIRREKEEGKAPIIVHEFLAQHLPPQFYYLALQESSFKYDAVGPITRYGYAKGIWQFIPSTAERYGLTVGPLSDRNTYDPIDERFDFPKATNAAARYIRDIFNTDAQASGLLVMASYNWGEGNIINLIRQMPENPRDRNFWNLLINHRDKIPDETYNYVFYIFSAAVICENPKMFGFNFDNPLIESIGQLN